MAKRSEDNRNWPRPLRVDSHLQLANKKTQLECGVPCTVTHAVKLDVQGAFMQHATDRPFDRRTHPCAQVLNRR